MCLVGCSPDEAGRNPLISEPMALILSPCWTLVLSACIALTVKADCGKDCELCLFHLQDRQVDLSTFTCIQECEGSLITTTFLDLCKNIFQGDGAEAMMEEDSAAIDGVGQDEDELSKRYGSFIRRFVKKSAEVGTETLDQNHGWEVPGKGYGGFMKKDGEGRLNVLKQLLTAATGEGTDREAVKRYGGFMRAVTRSAELEDGVKALQKRYGGFMRRVGSPNWEENQKIYGELLKRSRWSDGETGSPLTAKR
ncbi:hypothetical protein AAFF_G00272340 [Aldrovandia affinis]|uniref:Synenkephalin n=1 Tax=Aldrovandia affinis TaxID=143900 RepID=A0AAD7RB18_9TELE|nr:hypothetical protein AAFF_G00272340 [Aldrovandia affinis]